jgi:hypothetical protein
MAHTMSRIFMINKLYVVIDHDVRGGPYESVQNFAGSLARAMC